MGVEQHRETDDERQREAAHGERGARSRAERHTMVRDRVVGTTPETRQKPRKIGQDAVRRSLVSVDAMIRTQARGHLWCGTTGAGMFSTSWTSESASSNR
jgi:hypothetical protein